MRFFLNQFDYEDKDPSVVYPPDPRLVQARPRHRRRLAGCAPEPVDGRFERFVP